MKAITEHELNAKIIHLIDFLKEKEVIDSKMKLYSDIGILRQSVTKIKQGRICFTVSHIVRICDLYDINPNWIFGFENSNIFRSQTIKNKQLQDVFNDNIKNQYKS